MRFPQPRSFTLAALSTLVSLSACHSAATFVAPANPESAVRGFLNAVKANSIAGMSELWGSKDGPASQTMTGSDSSRNDMHQRLTVMRIYLEHDKFDIMPANETTVSPEGRHRIDVRIYRKGCTPVVPFTMVRAGTGWLVWNVDLVAAGNPATPCSGTPGH